MRRQPPLGRGPLALLLGAVLLGACGVYAGAPETLAPAASQADDPFAALVRQVRADPKSHSYLDLSLAVAREIYPELNAERERGIRGAFERHAKELREDLADARTPRARIEAANRLLYQKLQLRTALDLKPEEEHPDQYFPHAVLERKKGVCLGLSLVYLCLAESAGLPVYPVHAPQHIFLRYDDGETKLNLEATLRGRIFTEDEFRNWHKLPDDALRGGDYFRTLGKLEALGDLFNAVAWCSAIKTAERKLTPEKAVLSARLCVEIGPDNYNNWDTLAEAYAYAGRPVEALEALHKAIAMRPPDMGAYNKEYWQRRLERFAKAVPDRKAPPEPVSAP